MARTGLAARRRVWTFESTVAAVGLLAALGLGAWWTGLAIADGAVGSTVIRFCISVVGGMYYLALFRIAMGTFAIRQGRAAIGSR